MNKTILIQVLIIMILFSCKKDNEFDFALIQTGDITDIDKSGATFHARISDLSNSKIINYGFVWSTEKNPEFHNSEKYIITGVPSIGTISKRISTTLINNLTYYVRAFIQNDNFITYGKAVTFTSLGSSAPDISDFFPKTGNINDTLHIIGCNFSYITSNNKVYIDNYQADVIYSVQDTLLAIIPEKLDVQSSTISVSIFGNETKSTDTFNLIPPILNDFNDKTGTFGSQLTISGNNFLSNPNSLKVYFDIYKAEIKEITNTSLSVVVPDSLNVRICNLVVLMNNLTATSIDSFKLESLVLNDFSPKTILTGEKITLTGNNFSPIPENNIIQVGGISAEVINASINKLEIIVPSQDNGVYPDRNVNLSIEVIGENETFNETILINDKWFRLKDFPSSQLWGNLCQFYNNCLYIICSDSDEVWKYDIESRVYYKLENFPGIIRDGGTGFMIGSKIYYGTGYIWYTYEYFADFWEFDLIHEKWEQKSSLPTDGIRGAFGFSSQSFGYIGAGRGTSYNNSTDEVWRYDPTNDTWSVVEKFPVHWGYWNSLSTSNNDYAFVGFGHTEASIDFTSRLYSYNFTTDKWERLSNIPLVGREHHVSISFLIDNLIYCKSQFSQNFWVYNIVSNDWTELDFPYDFDFERGMSTTDNKNRKGYFGLGRNNTIWEYDPNR